MLVLDRLAKNYPSFSLKDVSFSVPPGFISGFIGVNGSGKTTTLKSIMNIVRPDSGVVTFEGRDLHAHAAEAKQRIGLMLGPVDVYPNSAVRKVVDVYRRFYDHWDQDLFAGYLDRFGIDDRKKISQLSTGMRVKLGISMALSHDARLLLLDEPTSGLDPIAREELLDLMQEVVEDGDRAVLFSTHFTGDLDRCADYIIFIRDGHIIAHEEKEDLLAKHALVKGTHEGLSGELESRLISCRRNAFGFTGLAHTSDLSGLEGSELWRVERPELESLMLHYELQRDR